jgi:hypothetical protein
MRDWASEILPASAARGEGDHPKGGGGVIGEACAIYPSTTLRVVPLPISDGEDYS